MNKATIYLCFGRAIIFIYLFLVFFIVLAETIVSRNTKSEPSNYEETTQVLKYVVQNINSPPMTGISITQGNTTIPGKSHILYNWEVKSDWCWCKDGYLFLGVCPSDSNFTQNDNSSTCKQWPNIYIPIDIWKGSALTVSFAASANWSFPLKSNYTCFSSFEIYQETSGLCTMNNNSIINIISAVNFSTSGSSYFNNVNWTLAGHFAGWGIAAPPIDDDEEETSSSSSEDNTTSTENSTTTDDNTTTETTSTTEDNTTSEDSTESDNNITTVDSSQPQKSNVDIPPDTIGYYLFYTTNTTEIPESTDDVESAVGAASKQGSPYINLKVARYGDPCLDPSKSPAPKYDSDYFPLTGNESQGCGYWNSSNVLYEKIDWIVDWNLFLNNDLAKDKSFFYDLEGFVVSTMDEFSCFYAERKLIVNDTDFCYSWVRNPEVSSDYSSVSLLMDMRNVVISTGFTVTTIAILSFLIHRITNRCKETTGGMYLFWFEYGLGTLNAVIALTVGILTRGMISTIDEANAYLYQVAENTCITNVPVFNNVYTYLSSQISELYSYVAHFNDFNIYAASIFLLLELILLVSWLICFQCKEELANEDSLSDNTKKKHQGIELA